MLIRNIIFHLVTERPTTKDEAINHVEKYLKVKLDRDEAILELEQKIDGEYHYRLESDYMNELD